MEEVELAGGQLKVPWEGRWASDSAERFAIAKFGRRALSFFFSSATTRVRTGTVAWRLPVGGGNCRLVGVGVTSGVARLAMRLLGHTFSLMSGGRGVWASPRKLAGRNYVWTEDSPSP